MVLVEVLVNPRPVKGAMEPVVHELDDGGVEDRHDDERAPVKEWQVAQDASPIGDHHCNGVVGEAVFPDALSFELSAGDGRAFGDSMDFGIVTSRETHQVFENGDTDGPERQNPGHEIDESTGGFAADFFDSDVDRLLQVVEVDVFQVGLHLCLHLVQLLETEIDVLFDFSGHCLCVWQGKKKSVCLRKNKRECTW